MNKDSLLYIDDDEGKRKEKWREEEKKNKLRLMELGIEKKDI